jgi:hypothetical protein
MAILVRGRWGIRRWTASPIGRLVTLPLWIPLAALRWDPTGHSTTFNIQPDNVLLFFCRFVLSQNFEWMIFLNTKFLLPYL